MGRRRYNPTIVLPPALAQRLAAIAQAEQLTLRALVILAARECARAYPDRFRAGKRLWTKADDRDLRRLYPDMPNTTIARHLRRTVYAIYGRADKLGLRKRTMALGSTRLVDGYVYRKIAETPQVPWTRNWKPEHVLIWERAHGPKPAGHAIVFKDGNRANCALDNLQLLTRRELMARNTVHNLPKPLASTIQLLGALNRQVRRRTRDGEHDRRSA